METVACAFAVWMLVLGILWMSRAMFEAVKILLYPAKIALDVGQGAWWVGKKSASVIKLVSKKKETPLYGDAAWATVKQLAAEGNLKAVPPGVSGFPIGKMDKTWVYAGPDRSVIMQAQTGFGKSLTMGATFFAASGEDLMAYDPAKQHWNVYHRSLAARGYRILRIDLDDPGQGVQFDPSWFIQGSTLYTRERDFETIASLLFPRSMRSDGRPDHFVSQGTLLIAAVLDYLARTQPDDAGLFSVAYALLRASKEVRDDMFGEIRKNAATSVILAINSFQEVGDRERGSIVSTVTNNLLMWTWVLYERLSRWEKIDGDRWTFEDLWKSDQPFALFITGGMGARSDVRGFLRMIFGLCAASRARSYGLERPLPRPMKMLIDEADNIGECMPVANIMTELRKTGIQVFMAFQSISQLYDNYSKARADTILDNVDIVSTGGIRNLSELKRLSALIGQRTVKAESKYSSGTGSQHDVARPLISEDELNRLPKDELVALLGTTAARLKRIWSIKNGQPSY